MTLYDVLCQVRKATEIVINAVKCRKMSQNVVKCRKMSQIVVKCRKLSSPSRCPLLDFTDSRALPGKWSKERFWSACRHLAQSAPKSTLKSAHAFWRFGALRARCRKSTPKALFGALSGTGPCALLCPDGPKIEKSIWRGNNEYFKLSNREWNFQSGMFFAIRAPLWLQKNKGRDWNFKREWWFQTKNELLKREWFCSIRAPLWPRKKKGWAGNFQARMNISNWECNFQAKFFVRGGMLFHAFEQAWFFLDPWALWVNGSWHRKSSPLTSPQDNNAVTWPSHALSGLSNANAKSQRFSYAISQIATLPSVVALNRKSQLDTLRFGTQFPKLDWPLSFGAP